ncbi:MAG TPA: HAD family hydrolase [Gaiellaceae bacterium]|jgi:HAD superfamily hydrolase (TIGR01549 family)
MAVEAVVFDVGETLIDETPHWTLVAEAAGVPPLTLMGVMGGLIARGRDFTEVWDVLGVARPEGTFAMDAWYDDALPCLARLREAGYRVCACGNTPRRAEDLVGPYVDATASSAGWGVRKPSPAFFERIAGLAGVEPAKIAYVGDRVDNDIEPALATGMVAVHIRRGPWGYLDEPPAAAIRIHSLDELPAVLP